MLRDAEIDTHPDGTLMNLYRERITFQGRGPCGIIDLFACASCGVHRADAESRAKKKNAGTPGEKSPGPSMVELREHGDLPKAAVKGCRHLNLLAPRQNAHSFPRSLQTRDLTRASVQPELAACHFIAVERFERLQELSLLHVQGRIGTRHPGADGRTSQPHSAP